MQPLPPDLAAVDVLQWIQHGIFLIRIKDEFHPAIMADVEQDPRRMNALRVLTQASNWQEVIAVRPSDVMTHWPMLGAINPEGSPIAVIVERLPRKQFMRTLNPGQCNINVPREREMRTKYGDDVVNSFARFSAPVVKAIFDPVYPSYKEARRMLEERSSVAISPLLVMLRDDFGKSVLYYRGRPAATIAAGGHPKLLSKCISAGVIAELLNERV